MQGVEDSRNRDGLFMDGYFISFPPGDFVHEQEDGSLSVSVDIYKVNEDYSMDRIPSEEVSADLHLKLEKFISEAINRAAREILEKENVEDQDR